MAKIFTRFISDSRDNPSYLFKTEVYKRETLEEKDNV